MPEQLNKREVRFCQLYAEYENAGRAYRESGLSEMCSEGSIYEMASQLLKKVEIQSFISELRNQASDAAKVSIERIAQGLARIAFANRADLFDAHGNLKPPKDWPEDVAATVEGIESEEILALVSEPGKPKRRELKGHTRKVKTAPRVQALKILAQWRRMIGQDAAVEQKAHEPLVVGGEADPNKL
jgi:phage terminase small subunit